MPYIENPKTKGSGILCAIPQMGKCPNKCSHCFFQSGRSYLEPLDENLPNLPEHDIAKNYIVRMNDGNDSNVQRELVVELSKRYPNVFFNTAIPKDLDKFPGPVVLTVNPGARTDGLPTIIKEVPKNLMFVRVRTNTWNLDLVDSVVMSYTLPIADPVPVVLTFMAYYSEGEDVPKDIPTEHVCNYEFRKRTLNNYWAIRRSAWKAVMDRYRDNRFVYSCGNESVSGGTACKVCGNCIREYYATRERMGGFVKI